MKFFCSKISLSRYLSVYGRTNSKIIQRIKLFCPKPPLPDNNLTSLTSMLCSMFYHGGIPPWFYVTVLVVIMFTIMRVSLKTALFIDFLL